MANVAAPPVSRFWFSCVCAFLVAALYLPGSASAQAESRHQLEIDSFERIYLSGPLRVHLLQQNHPTRSAKQGGSPGAYVTGSAASVGQLKIEQSDATLYLDLPAGALQGGQSDLTIYLPFTELKEVVSQGGAQVFADQIRSENLALESQGEGQFVLQRILVDDLVIVGQGNTTFFMSGIVQHQLIEIAGLGRFHGAALQSETSHISVQGAGQVDVWARELLQVNVSGTAKVRYDGSPWIHQQIQGSGAITRLF